MRFHTEKSLSYMKKYKIDIILNLIGLAIITYFFLPLFYPHLSLFVTPEVGVSDLWQFNIPVKFLMSQAIHGHYFPLWTDMIGTGYPILAESQMGFFNIFSLTLYSLFSYLVAFNLQYIFIYFFAFSGMYAFLRNMKVSPAASFLGGFSFAFSGFYITHISHQNMILTASYIPWLFLLIDLFTRTKKSRYLLISILFLSQQLFAGYVQITFITWIFMGLYLIFNAYVEKKKIKKSVALRTGIIGVLVGVVFIISAAQVIPTAELIDHTARKNGLSPTENIQYSYPFKHLITFLDPFLLGSPRDGTYPHYNLFDGSIFWENTGYIGLIPLVLAVLSLFTVKKNKKTLVFILLLLSALLLMTGKHSPFYFIHTLPPINRFRIPSRYLIMFVFSLCIMSAIGFDELMKRIRNRKIIQLRAILSIVLVSLSVYNIFLIWGNYHLIGRANEWFSDSQTGAYIKHVQKPGRVFSILGASFWVDYFLKNGWSKNSNYFYFRNGLSPNYNILAGVDEYDAYVGKVNTNRQLAYRSVVLSGITEEHKNTLKISTMSAKLLGLASVRYFIAPEKIDNTVFKQKFSTTQNPVGLAAYNIFENSLFLPRVRIVYDYSISKTLQSLQEGLISSTFDPRKSVLLESEPHHSFEKKCIDSPSICPTSVSFTKDKDTLIELTTTSINYGLLVLADSYYPGWKALIDNKETEIFPANLNQRAIILPAGKHTVRFEYKPVNFARGLWISILGYATIIFLLVIEWRTSFLDTFFRKWKLFSDL
ncbi:hypothetical protein A3H83_03390 [Candidatus Roizmanbacteria bacterium RIFCSPLOWO2_02_FULL_39_8]|uniref:Membrane protein 6-pyruvoyl-tetrahydropterin synthase-related domain-containing protein n=1 Tax=Candidatus Roizmanbacteria bacterium RIFCSPHIGHO2_01_FULL_39_24 TaxID=1802032 RepID=A0A1F7GI03_9BACT|nr:MAG: hypothetical protein A2799_03945 [Candidatus Roizmanbacteria bacterium RIFCSPHIGHO2_01_FULL_39_24]OGK56588.1 MAG: hypothetical protein A3H83_03390 [Candidatus Roizmanbacteria bacterium RIFCSPLOWO2_02_FULL_39_8]